MKKIKLTKSVIDKAKVPESGQAFIRDSLIPGFSLRTTATGAKSFILEKRIKGKVRRMTLGKYGTLTCEQARKLAQNEAGKIAMGHDPIKARQQEEIKGLSLVEAYKEYLETRNDLHDKTRRDYDIYIYSALEKWLNKPLTEITKSMILKEHKRLSTKVKSKDSNRLTGGKVYANRVMQLLRAIYNVMQAKYDDLDGISLIPENPVQVLTRMKAWHKVERRQTLVKVVDLPEWYQAVKALPEKRIVEDYKRDCNTVASDLLLFLLFTGLRKNEALSLKWKNVNFKAKTFTIPDTKNGKPHTLPLSDYLTEILNDREESRVNDYVFPGREENKPLVEPKKAVKWVVEESGIHFMLHDLRRTFITTAEKLDISPYTIKRLVNHTTRSDVTSGYIVIDIDRLQEPMQKITDYLVKALGIKETPVIQLITSQYLQK